MRPRLRDLGIIIGTYPPGRENAITDVPGVQVGHTTLIYDQPRTARTGVTIILPRPESEHDDHVFAGYHQLNGCGEMTGIAWLQESGTLTSPIALTNTHQVGTVHDALVNYAIQQYGTGTFHLSVVAETWDGWLNDADAFHLTQEHVFAAIRAARGGPVAEGNVGGGTGMICHDFKGGIGTASRQLPAGYILGALVQSNYGHYSRSLLRVDGVPVGREIPPSLVPTPFNSPRPGTPSSSSWPPTPHCCLANAGDWPNGPPSAWPAPAAWGTTAAATSSWPLPPGTISRPGPMPRCPCKCCPTTT